MPYAKEHLAHEAQRLLNDEFLAHAVSLVKAEAIAALCNAKPDDLTEIVKCQQTVLVCENLVRELHRHILAMPVKDDSRPV